jgi:hypothetical protein
MKKFKKGDIIFVCGYWFVVVRTAKDKDGEPYICCICDNANNQYTHNFDEVEQHFTAYEAVRANGWGDGPDTLNDLKCDRPIPIDVIAEVLVGCHDKRWP